MGVRQEKRPFAPQPEVHVTDYGAKYVNAATETGNGPESVGQEEAVVASEPQEMVTDGVEPAEKPGKKKGGRPKKAK